MVSCYSNHRAVSSLLMCHKVLRSRGFAGMRYNKSCGFTSWFCHLLGKFINLPGSQLLPLQDEEVKEYFVMIKSDNIGRMSWTVHATSMVALLLLAKAM